MNKKFNDVLINVNGETRKAAFASFNRELNLKNVELLTERMKLKGYRKGEEIKVIKAENAINEGVCDLQDINGNAILSNFEGYFFVGDGQHRTYAVSEYNAWALENGKDKIEVPAIEAELKDETITEYINEINITKKEWVKEDYVRSAAQIDPEIKLLQVYSKRIKSNKNPFGFSLSTLNLIYCNGSSFAKNDFYLLCTGATKKGKNKQNDIIPSHNIENGDKFINICKSKKFADKEISKRYLIKNFIDIKTEHDVYFAFEVLNGITPNDYAAMTENDKLVESKVNKHFKVMAARLQKSKEQAVNSNNPESFQGQVLNITNISENILSEQVNTPCA
jgi:hypothetical protein